MSASQVLDRIMLGLDAGPDAPELVSGWVTRTREAIEAVERLHSSLNMTDGGFLWVLVNDARQTLRELEGQLAYVSQRLHAGR